MILNPFIPLPIMGVICVLLLIMKRRGAWNYIKQIIIVLLIFGMNMRLMIPTDKAIVVDNQVDILFVFDNTISMLAEDHGTDNDRRIDGAKKDVKKIIDAFPGARFALITFNNRADLVVPYTMEGDLVLETVDNLEGILSANADGTSLNISIDKMYDTLYHNLEISDNEDENFAKGGIPKRIQLVFYISDGEITNHESLDSFEDVSEFVDSGAVLGYGTSSGGIMKVPDYYGNYETLKYYNNNFDNVTARSYIDEDNLEMIAEDMGIEYYHIKGNKDINDVIDDITDQIDDGEFITREAKMEGYKETYHFFAMGLILFVSVDYVYTRLKMRRER
ncbi:MAG: VWA domain-containing protein [Saccharofermentans sp.]|nr:VWA domain-containing protein [Saccharofermentans sp.]